MALREEQILRYSRQILLREVGGRGQERLLEGGVRLSAGGPAGLTAAAYLAAGGTAVEADATPLAPGAEGFLVGAGEVGMAASEVLGRVLPEVNPDSGPARGTGMLSELPATWHGEGPWVALGGDGARGAVVFRARGGCPRCFERTVAMLDAPPRGALAAGLGALGALILQRLLLGLGPVLGGRWWEAPGLLTDLPVLPCGDCPPSLPEDLSELLRHLESTWPAEGCGVLLRHPERGTWRVRPLRNAYDEHHAKEPTLYPHTSRTAWLFDPLEWLTVLRETDARGEQLACVYHSHADTGAYLSDEDRHHAAPGGELLLPGVSYLVVAVHGGTAREARLYWRGLECFQERRVSLES
jgi:molybdopterin-synthase adenylyltransferase